MDNFTILDEFHNVIDKFGDPRIKEYYLMASPIPTLALSLVYYISITVLIPTYMKHKKPYKIQNFIIIYNGLQVLFSAWLFYGFTAGGWFAPTFNGKCLLPGRGENMIFVSYLYFLSKFTEFADTILFALTKKENQITRLHLYHHCIMPIGSWLGIRFDPVGAESFIGLLNSFVHIVMYSYYMLSAMGPKMKKYLWWKKYITVLQLIQFVMALSHSILTATNGCNMPTLLSYFNISQSLVFFLMFSDFYLQAYKKKGATSSSNEVDKKVAGEKIE